jgi:DNA replication and repair protein RecF
MAVEALELTDFRCFAQASLAPDPGTNLVIGPNGSGKTTVLEALHVIGTGRSFRVRELSPLVRFDQARFTVAARIGQPRQTVAAIGGTGGLELTLNGQPLRGTAELAAVLPVQALHPEMHALIEGPPEGRRRFVDWGTFHVKQRYLDAWRAYQRALRQRNAILKQNPFDPTRRVWDQELVTTGEQVDRDRRAYLDRLAGAFEPMATGLLQAPAAFRYRPGWIPELGLAEALERSLERDQQLRSTQVGPHRADLEIRLADTPSRYLASRGQQKLLAVGLGFAQAQVIASAAARPMVLLLDDPMAEIDGDRAALVVRALAEIPAQRFVTGLLPETWPGPVDALFHVKHGELGQVI